MVGMSPEVPFDWGVVESRNGTRVEITANERSAGACLLSKKRPVREAAGPSSGEAGRRGLAPSWPPGTWPPLWRHSLADSGEGGSTPQLHHEYAGNPEFRGQQGTRGREGAAGEGGGRIQARSHGLTSPAFQ